MTGDITGSWFPSGYYGHFRSKSRNDYLQEYRLAARPTPPEKLVQRLKDNPRKHSFSAHDNRHVFQTNAHYFESGLGRKKVKSSVAQSSRFNPTLISWMPLKLELSGTGPLFSTYRNDFHNSSSAGLSLQNSSQHTVMPILSPSESYNTTYQHAYSHCQPNSKIQTNMLTGRVSSESLVREATYSYFNGKPEPSFSNPRRPKSTPLVTLSVSDCLKWHTTGN
ncbi:uncharacterized protein C3orf84-like [Erpetoichthys calabaricus]|uniref:uncharacterized protein C3orf84-like n=1 Tax=Erpetoichthys calabaricus TaxID=27687 RepID=UPI002234DCE0|nr:uncharacterized protein C3orf84-like [Erpetoichthys calabaricus]